MRRVRYFYMTKIIGLRRGAGLQGNRNLLRTQHFPRVMNEKSFNNHSNSKGGLPLNHANLLLQRGIVQITKLKSN